MKHLQIVISLIVLAIGIDLLIQPFIGQATLGTREANVYILAGLSCIVGAFALMIARFETEPGNRGER